MSLYIGYMVHRLCSPKWRLRLKLVKVMQMVAFLFCEVREAKPIIRCTDYRSRPSHADQLHVDLWIRGQQHCL